MSDEERSELDATTKRFLEGLFHVCMKCTGQTALDEDKAMGTEVLGIEDGEDLPRYTLTDVALDIAILREQFLEHKGIEIKDDTIVGRFATLFFEDVLARGFDTEGNRHRPTWENNSRAARARAVLQHRISHEHNR